MMMAGALLCAGCEDGDDGVEDFFDDTPVDTDGRSVSTNNIYITPLSVTLDTDGLQAVFTAHEGRGPYTWSVSDPSRGSIHVDAWSQGLYTRLTKGDNSVTVRDSSGHWDVALVSQPDGAVTDALVVSPSSCTLSGSTNAVVLTAAGGAPPYAWSVEYNTGRVSPDAGENTVYTRTDYSGGDNIVWCRDSKGNKAYAVIHQE